VRDGSAANADAAAGTGGKGGGADSGARISTCADADCDDKATCADSTGDAECTCIKGFVGDGKTCGNVNECAVAGLAKCGDNAACVDAPGSFSCECDEGFSGDGKTCDDVDECTLGTKACDANATCENTVGSATCSCNTGYVANGAACDDVNECTGSSPPACDANATCVNTQGSAFCMCNTGYNGNGMACSMNAACDVANGAMPNAACDALATCTTIGAGDFCVCPSGYTGDGSACANIDECDVANPTHLCHSAADCADTAGSYTCTCKAGFTGDGVTCADINECMENTDNCHALAMCNNTAGSFTCTCPSGYSGDGTTCANIDECASPSANDCHMNANCTDTPGSFTCACKSGFIGDGKDSCVDVDECANSTLNTCEPEVTCQNVAGGFTCDCSAPYKMYGATCACDLTGTWGMRQEVTATWPQTVTLQAGTLHSTVWELHRLEYDGSTVTVRKKGCGSDKTPDLRPRGLWSAETYGTYIPDAVWDAFPIFNAKSVSLAAAKPLSAFVTTKEASVLGLELDNWDTDPWPASNADAVPHNAYDDALPGLMVWARNPTQTTQAGNKYSYPIIGLGTRGVCISTATRSFGHLEGALITCGRITGDVKRDYAPGADTTKPPKVEARTFDCRRPVDENAAYGCTEDEWNDISKMTKCNGEEDLLDDQVDQTESEATFEMIKLSGDPEADIDCADVRTHPMLPAYP
jgi:EGF domain/Calcium-binding EGF domain